MTHTPTSHNNIMTATILGCGASAGVPRLGGKNGCGDWGNCDPSEPRNTRSRCSMLIEKHNPNGGAPTRVLIDPSPDLRTQLLKAEVASLDGVLVSHEHADHIHGIDDLRAIVHNIDLEYLPLWAGEFTSSKLMQRFGYLFKDIGLYRQLLTMHTMTADDTITIAGHKDTIDITPHSVIHGSVETFGFHAGNMLYTPDIGEISQSIWDVLKNCDYWVVDCLRVDPHPTHSHLSQTLQWIEQSGVKKAILTNMHSDLDYQHLISVLPHNIIPAYDGLSFSIT